MDLNYTNISDYDFENSSGAQTRTSQIDDKVDYLYSNVCLHTDGFRTARKTYGKKYGKAARKAARETARKRAEALKSRKHPIIGSVWLENEWPRDSWVTCDQCEAILDPALVYRYSTTYTPDETCLICYGHLVPILRKARDCRLHKIHKSCKEDNTRPCPVCNNNADSSRCHVCNADLVPEVITTCGDKHHFHAACITRVMNSQCSHCRRFLCPYCRKNVFHPSTITDVDDPNYADFLLYEEIGG